MRMLENYVDGIWTRSKATGSTDVINPATQEILGKVPNGKQTVEDVNTAVAAASSAFKSWRQAPVMKRVQPLYKLKQLLEDNAEEIARTITLECGKTLAESRGELQRAIENVEVACGAPLRASFCEGVDHGAAARQVREVPGREVRRCAVRDALGEGVHAESHGNGGRAGDRSRPPGAGDREFAEGALRRER